MRIGLKRHRVDLERAVKTQTSTGALEKTWQRIGRVWADVIPLRGEESYNAQELEATVTHTIRMRRTEISATLTAADRIRFGSRYFELTSVIDINERRREMELNAREVTT